MKALSIKQPWADLIVSGGKDIENRSWRTPYRGTFAVHAGKSFDIEGYLWLLKQDWTPPMSSPKNHRLGGIVGHATIVDCVTEHESPWFFGPYGFVLSDAHPVAFTPCKGQLGWFEV